MPEILTPNCVIADNWSLQLVAQALSEGLELGEGALLVSDKDSDSHVFREVPAGALAIEALFDLVADIVLREQIWVDEEFRQAWEGRNSELDALVREGVVVPFRFLAQPQELEEPRRFFVSKLCFTDSLRRAQLENEAGWLKTRSAPHPYLSQVVWGGAGMLARSLVYQHAYTPFPVRRRLMVDAGLAWSADATQNLRNLISQKQAQMSVVEGNGSKVTRLKINGAEIAALAIREASKPEDLIRIALQLRAEYTELRGWLTEYQRALQAGDLRALGRCESLLRSASAFVDSRLGQRSASGPTFTVGWGLLQVALQGSPLDALLNRVGVRAQINQLMFAQRASADLDKLLGLFGQRTRRTGLAIREHFEVFG